MPMLLCWGELGGVEDEGDKEGEVKDCRRVRCSVVRWAVSGGSSRSRRR